MRFEGNARQHSLGRRYYGESSPHPLWVTMSRARNKKGILETGYRVSNRNVRAKRAAHEYGHRFCCEEGFRDCLMVSRFSQARIKEINACPRLFALFAIALLALTTLGMALLIRGGPDALRLVRRVASRRSNRCELSLIAALIALVQPDRCLFTAPSPHTKLNLKATLSNVS